VTTFGLLLNYCMLLGLGLLGLGIDFGSGYAHVFMPPYVVIVTVPNESLSWVNWGKFDTF